MFINELFENSEDMFATPWRVKVAKLLQKMLDNPSIQRNYEIVPDDLEDIQRLITALQSGNIDAAKKVWGNFDYNELDNALYLYIHRLRPEIDLFKLLGDEDDYLEESDDMFASPFRVERDVMMWQRTASRVAGTRGMHSKNLGLDIIFWIEDTEGNVTGAYYSPQPASDDTNIGTWNKNFRGDLDQYMARDPHNPFKQVNEEDDDMFSAEPRQFQKLGDSIENYAEGYIEMGRDVQYSQDEAVAEYAGDLIRNGKAMLRAGQSFQRGMQAGLVEWVLVDSDTRESYYTFCREVEGWDAEALINDYVGLNEEAAGVGVVSNSKDPRYVMATMGDQNDVTAATLPKMMRAYSLVGKKAKK